MERAQGATSGGTRTPASGSGHDVPDFETTKPPSYRPPPDAVGPAALRGDDPFIMQADGKGWLFAPTGLHRRPAADALRAARVAGPQPAVRPAGQPDPQGATRGPDNPSNPSPPERHAEVFPYVLHHLPADRAPHRRRDEPARCRTWPSCSRRCSSRCPRQLAARARAGAPRLGHVVTSRTAIEARVLVTDRLRPLRVRRPDRAPGLAALPLGRRRAGHRRRGQRPVRRRARPERATSRRARWPPATSGRAAGRAGRRCWRYVDGLPAAGRRHAEHRHELATTGPEPDADRERAR